MLLLSSNLIFTISSAEPVAFRSQKRCEVVRIRCARIRDRCSPEHLEDRTVVVQPNGGLLAAVGARLQGLRQEHVCPESLILKGHVNPPCLPEQLSYVVRDVLCVPNDASAVEEPAG